MLIATQRLLIRPFEFEDWRTLRQIAKEFQASKYRYFDHEIPTEIERIQSVARYCASTGMWFSVLLRGEMIGYICLSGEGCSLDLGYGFHSSAHGKGYAFESITALLELLESTGAVRQFTAGTALENLPSVKLLTRLGFEKVSEETVCFYEGHPFLGGSFEKKTSQ